MRNPPRFDRPGHVSRRCGRTPTTERLLRRNNAAGHRNSPGKLIEAGHLPTGIDLCALIMKLVSAEATLRFAKLLARVLLFSIEKEQLAEKRLALVIRERGKRKLRTIIFDDIGKWTLGQLTTAAGKDPAGLLSLLWLLELRTTHPIADSLALAEISKLRRRRRRHRAR